MNVFTVHDAENSIADYTDINPEADIFDIFESTAVTSWTPPSDAEFGAALIDPVKVEGIKWPPRKV